MDIERLMERHPGCVPVIIQSRSCQMKKTKFLVPYETTVSDFIYVLRSYIPTLLPGDSLFLFVGHYLPTPTTTIQHLYIHHEQDLILHMHLAKEEVFG